jgi:hypothetical protein
MVVLTADFVRLFEVFSSAKLIVLPALVFCCLFKTKVLKIFIAEEEAGHFLSFFSAALLITRDFTGLLQHLVDVV